MIMNCLVTDNRLDKQQLVDNILAKNGIINNGGSVDQLIKYLNQMQVDKDIKLEEM